jgi:colicin import membrane protein
MRFTNSIQAAVWPAVAGLALLVVGCAESTTQKDMAEAQRDLREAQQDTREAQREAQENVAAAQRDAHTVNRPVIDQDAVADARRDVDEARREGAENVAEQKRDEAEAAANLQKTQREFQATQARDAFVKDTEMKLADAERRIDQLEAQAAASEGATRDALNARVKALNTQHDAAEDALGEVKRADLDKWTIPQAKAHSALQDLMRDLNANR